MAMGLIIASAFVAEATFISDPVEKPTGWNDISGGGFWSSGTGGLLPVESNFFFSAINYGGVNRGTWKLFAETFSEESLEVSYWIGEPNTTTNLPSTLTACLFADVNADGLWQITERILPAVSTNPAPVDAWAQWTDIYEITAATKTVGGSNVLGSAIGFYVRVAGDGSGKGFVFDALHIETTSTAPTNPVPEGVLIAWDAESVLKTAGIDGSVFLAKAYGVQNLGGSTDGTFGSGINGASTNKMVYMVNTTSNGTTTNHTVGIQIVNNTGSTIQLDTLSFDYSRWWNGSPQDITLTYAYGDLDVDNGAVVHAATGLPTSPQTGDYPDFDWSLAGLPDFVLADGQRATFNLTVSNSTSDNNAGGIDNIALSGSVISKSAVLDAATPTSVTVWLLAGQSNMRGHGDPAEITDPVYQVPQSDVLHWHNQHNEKSYTTAGTGDDYGWEVLDWGGGRTETDGDGGFGPELSFGRTMADEFPEHRIALIKHAIGGTSLHTEWNTAGAGGYVYNDFIETTRAALQDLANRGIAYKIEGMVWMQGEHDTTTLADANNYAANLAALIAAVRTEFNEPAMAFVAGRIRGFGSYTNEVRAAITSVTEADPLAAWVDIDDLPLVAYDNVHLNTFSQLEFGKRMALAYLAHIHAKEITQAGFTEGAPLRFWIKWNGHTGENYRILTSTNLMANAWEDMASNLVATLPENTYTNPSTMDVSRFFKVERN